MVSRLAKIAVLPILLNLVLMTLTGCSSLRNEAILVPPDTPKWVKGVMEIRSVNSLGDTLFCLTGDDFNETYRYIRDTCLICHEFDATKPFPKPVH